MTNPRYPILIADDQRTALMMLKAILKRAGLENIVECPDSRQVMNAVHKSQVELALLDLNMPNIGGEELLAQIGDSHPDVPVIIVTAAEEVETAVRCMKNGAFDYIVKPVNPERLITAVTRALEMRMLKREIRELKKRMQTDALRNPDIFSNIVIKTNKCSLFSSTPKPLPKLPTRC